MATATAITRYALEYFDNKTKNWNVLDYCGTIPHIRNLMERNLNKNPQFYWHKGKPMKLRVRKVKTKYGEVREELESFPNVLAKLDDAHTLRVIIEK